MLIGNWIRPLGRRRSLGVAAAVLAMAAGRVPEAEAAAWNAPAGQGLVIVEGTLDSGSRSYDLQRHLINTDPYSKKEGSAYLEYGVTDWFEAILKPDLVAVNLGGSPGGHYTGLGTSEAGAQFRLLAFGPAVLAVQGTFQLPATTREENLALIGNTSRNTDGRALLGYGFVLGSWLSFVDAEAGYRIRTAGAPDEVHADFTFGTRPLPNLLLLLQDFTTIPVGESTSWFPRSQYSNLKASFVYDLGLRWSVQLGAFTTVEGRNALNEHGLDLALWYRF